MPKNVKYHTIALISHASKVTFKILQARLKQYINQDLPMFTLDLKKGEEPKIKQPTSIGSLKKQQNSREKKKSTSSPLTTLRPLTVWITANQKIFKEIEILDYLTCLMRNLYAGQEAMVRTRHGIKDWFKIWKVCIFGQACIFSPYLFNLYAEYIM